MDERLHRLIDEYKETVARAVAALEASGIPRPASTTEWIGYDLPGRGELVGGGEYFMHGFGCEVRLPDVWVDFDFGDQGPRGLASLPTFILSVKPPRSLGSRWFSRN